MVFIMQSPSWKNWALSEFGVGHCRKLIHQALLRQPPLYPMWVGTVPPEGLGQQPAQGPTTLFLRPSPASPCSGKEPQEELPAHAPRPGLSWAHSAPLSVSASSSRGGAWRSGRRREPAVGTADSSWAASPAQVCPAPRAGACPYVPQPRSGGGGFSSPGVPGIPGCPFLGYRCQVWVLVRAGWSRCLDGSPWSTVANTPGSRSSRA